MHFLTHIKDLFADFLFPKSELVLTLEKLSTDELIYNLPPAEILKDKYSLVLFDYSHPLVKEMIWELKYSGNMRIADKLGEILYDHLQHELTDLSLFESARWHKEKPIIMPVPISNERRFERGWNQSELLSEQIMRCDSNKIFRYIPKQLVKIRHTKSQTKTLSKNERLENLTYSMKVLNPSSVAGAHVIVLDDVTTTGATFAEARRALRVAGARNILCIAVAH
ncbi:MAG: phosphoribosyltransferase family protein [bacterium]|nr:phosphoribosyltransferase family protein [bacterium]